MKTLILSIIIAGLYGCGSKGDSNSDSASSLSLIGNWKSPCMGDAGDVEMNYDSKTSTLTASIYSDTGCQNKIMIFNEVRSYSISGENIDYTFQSVMLTIIDRTTVDNCNASQCFGKDNWALNVSQSVAGLSVDSTSEPFNQIGSKLFQIFKLEGSGVQFGDTSGADNGSTVELRPTTFDPIVLKKF